MRGQKDKIYKKRIPLEAFQLYLEIKKYPIGTEFTFEQLCRMFPKIEKKIIGEYLECLVENDWLDEYVDVHTYTLHVDRQFKVFLGE